MKRILFLLLGLGALLPMACDDSTIDDNNPLSGIQLMSPIDGDTLRQETRIQIASSDFGRLVVVGLRVDGEEVAISTNSPYDNDLDVRSWADDQEHELEVWGAASNSSIVVSDPVTVTVSASASAPAQPRYFYRTHNLSGNDWIQTLAPVGNGWLAGGSAGDQAWLMRLDREGDMVWSWRFGTGNGQINAVLPVDGGSMVAGKLDGYPWVAKLNHRGYIVSSRGIDQYGEGSISDLIATSDGQGWLAIANTQAGARLMELDGTGAIVWDRSPLGGQTGTVERLLNTQSGDLWICGAWTPDTNREALLVSTDQTGTVRWTRSLGAGYAWDLKEDGAGLVVCGETGSDPAAVQATLWRTDNTGVLVESRVMQQNAPHSAHRLLKSTGGDWWLAGWSAGAQSNGLDGLLAEVSFGSGTLWQHSHGDGLGQELRALLPAADGGLVAAGMSGTSTGNGMDVWVIHTNTQGLIP
ncbi:MAG: hypothetical protein KC488_00225 [Candidatus Cloacimonetes bacterium]|nr:hypothetical protein [Candidatus Cloacimonadota bacterium]